MSKKKEYPKYQKCDASTLIPIKFGKLEPGNLFFMEEFKYEMLMIVTNERKDMAYDRNCTTVVAQDKNYCGLSFWLADDEDVYVVEDSNIVLHAYYLL